ncbi:PucR family transcriptional regulator [Brevibacterium aurantiacum]|uniref:PucR family transcriptional regulator n=1 Tax=Brevibacterium aurantiacum TaxID=273384 RepID=UPI001865B745|nr:PucR family transcriptional regulator [Brevibacterium aurantiacum]
MESISDLADQLAHVIQHGVAVYDKNLRLLGHSTHFGDADLLRLESLVGRQIDNVVRDVAVASGFLSWREPVHRRALGVAGYEHDRVAFPLRSRYELLGIISVLVEDELTEEETQLCLDVAHKMEVQLASEADFNREVETMLLTLLSGKPEDREASIRDLLARGIFEHSTVVTAMVLVIYETAGSLPLSHHESVIRRALKQATSAQLGQSSASAVTDDRAFLLVGGQANTSRAELVKLADRLVAEVVQLNPELSEKIGIGIGSTVHLCQTSDSYNQASVATQIAKGNDLAVAFWEDHPLEGLLTVAINSEIEESWIPSIILSMVEAQPAEVLSTVASFLDNAGNVARTSEVLHFHRTTVYYRLKQFEKATGLSLEDGHHRLLLHLWLNIRDRISSSSD